VAVLIKYRSGYKYQLAENYVHGGTEIYKTNEAGDFVSVVTDYIIIDEYSRLTIFKGYCWDGPSGPAIDTKNFMRGSLVHDALYQLMRMGKLDSLIWRNTADRLLRKICREDGMSWIRAWWVYRSLVLFARSASDPENQKEIKTPPPFRHIKLICRNFWIISSF